MIKNRSKHNFNENAKKKLQIFQNKQIQLEQQPQPKQNEWNLLFKQAMKIKFQDNQEDIDIEEIKEIIKNKKQQIDKESLQKVCQLLKRSLFSSLQDENESIIKCCQNLNIYQFSKGQKVLSYRHAVNNYYIVLQGKIQVKDVDQELVKEIGYLEVVDRKLYNTSDQQYTCLYNATALMDCTLVGIDIKTFEENLQEKGVQQRNAKLNFLYSVGLFVGIARTILVKLCQYIDEVEMVKDQWLYHEGDTRINQLFIIQEGEFKVFKKFKVAGEGQEDNTTDPQLERTSSHCVFNQTLYKTLFIRLLTKRHVVGLEEVLHRYSHQEAHQQKRKKNRGGKQKVEDIPKYSGERLYSVQCSSQKAQVLVIQQELFYEHFYNLIGAARNNTHHTNQSQAMFNPKLNKNYQTFLSDHSQYVVYDRQRNLRNYNKNNNNKNNNNNNNNNNNSQLSKDNNKEQSSDPQKIVSLEKIKEVKEKKSESSIGQQNQMQNEVNLPHIHEFRNVKDKHKEIGKEERVRLNHIKRKQLGSHYDLELIYRGKLLNNRCPSLVPPPKHKQQIFIDFFQNQFLNYNIHNNQTFIINQQIVKMKGENDNLNRELKGQYTSLGIDSSHINVDEWQQQQQQQQQQEQEQQLCATTRNKAKSQTFTGRRSRWIQKELNQTIMKKKAIRDYYHYFNVDEVDRSRLFKSQCLFNHS